MPARAALPPVPFPTSKPSTLSPSARSTPTSDLPLTGIVSDTGEEGHPPTPLLPFTILLHVHIFFIFGEHPHLASTHRMSFAALARGTIAALPHHPPPLLGRPPPLNL
ncbi:hypothetical protein PVAP13_4NG215698 [Panicum virgatum]|uniref:Uncharacterized protein n=1 Tax=Panicum virgatum TaxID=38727 RepID=A0A8T0T618_PANVG|nr:hypothetical protein PVAP13_4NG215698 [Panicum virgatum]